MSENMVESLETGSEKGGFMALRIVGRRENDTGANTHYKLSDGRIVTREEAVKLCKLGYLPGYNIIMVNGVEYLRDNPDTKVSDNIDSQPLI
ncbi:MAG: DUF3892 domain-containing protein [Candidatus Omnitrophota bacterium]|jgi:hypothetical protein